MSLKTSFCNKSIIKSDFKRLWWISVLHTLAIFMMSVYLFIDKYFNGYIGVTIPAEVAGFAHSTLYRYSTPFFVLALFVPVLLGVFLFSYMQSGKPSAFQHSIPVLRKTHYISHLISGVIMFMLPIVINGAILLLMRFDSGFAAMFKVSHLFTILGITALYSLIAFSGAVFVSMITANVVSSIIFTYVFAVLPILCEAFLSSFLSTQLFGYPEGDITLFETLYFSPLQLRNGSSIALYLAISTAFLAAGYFIYKARHLENHSEVVAFPSLRPVFIFGVGICAGCFGFSYFNSFWQFTSSLALIPFGILGIIIATMIVNKSFRILRRVYKSVIIYTLAVLALFCTLEFDLTGYETRVPNPDKVEGVNLDLNINMNTHQYTISGDRIILMNSFEPYVTDESVIRSIAALHTDLINKKSDDGKRVYIEYTLKNGRKLKRTYTVDFESQAELLEPICESDVIRKAFFPILREGERNIKTIQLRHDRLPEIADIDKAVYDELLTALKTDLQNADYKEYVGRRETIASLYVNFTEPSLYENGKTVPDNLLNVNRENYYIRPSYVNTIAVLEKLGLWKPFPTAEDIDKIGIDVYLKFRHEAASSTQADVATIDEQRFDIVIDNPEEIKELFDYTEGLIWTRSYDLNLSFYLKDGTWYSSEIDASDPKLPQFLKDKLS